MIKELIDKALLEKEEARKTRVGAGKWKPSLFGRCYRMQYWTRKNEPYSDPIDSRTLRVFAVGNVFHDWIEKLIPDIQTEVLIETNDIKGFADIVTGDAVWDIKTVHSGKFWHLEKETDVPITKRERHNFLQVGFYASYLKKPNMGICMVSKDDLCIAEYKEETDKWEPEVKKEILTLRDIWAKDELPSPTPRAYPTYSKGKFKGFKECSYCNYRTKCEEVEGCKTKPKSE